jgi:Spy/CpxP family protein refolding chaperone
MKIKKVSVFSMVLISAMLLSAFVPKNSFGQKAEKQENVKNCKKDQGCHKKGSFSFIPNLTEDQKTKINDLHLIVQKDVLQLKNQMGEKEAHLKTVSMVDKVDMVEVNKTIDEMFVLKASIAKKKEAFHQDVRNLLTVEQKVVFDSKMGCEKKMGHGKCKMNGDNNCSGKGNGKGSCNGNGYGNGKGNCNGNGNGSGNGNNGNCPNKK